MRNFWIAVILFLTPFGLLAQKSYEAGLLFGGSAYSGDLSPEATNWSTGKVHPALGVFFRYNANRYFSARLNAAYATISGTDAESKDPGRFNRNLSFESDIFELGVTGELYIFGYQAQGLQKRFSPYIFGGVSVFKFNPKANYQGQNIALQPLGTEGQGIEGYGEPYKLTQVAVPFGAGFKFAISERLNIGAEVGVRRTFTDYLDDVSGTYADFDDLQQENGNLAVALSSRTGELENPIDDPILRPAAGSQRGNPAVDDWYAIGGLTLSYTFYPRSGLGRGSNKKDFGCPKF